jgi:hypothetical protein
MRPHYHYYPAACRSQTAHRLCGPGIPNQNASYDALPRVNWITEADAGNPRAEPTIVPKVYKQPPMSLLATEHSTLEAQKTIEAGIGGVSSSVSKSHRRGCKSLDRHTRKESLLKLNHSLR